MQIQYVLVLLLLFFNSSCGFNASLTDILSSEEPSVEEPGTTPQPTSPLVVEVNQRSTQSDPTSTLPIEFIIEFSEPIVPSELTTSDIQVTGTASGVSLNIINSGDDKSFLVQVVAVTNPGEIHISLPSGSVTSVSGISNLNTVSTDPKVTYQIPSGGAPYMLKNISTGALGTNIDSIHASIGNLLNVDYDDGSTQNILINVLNKNKFANTVLIPNIDLEKAYDEYLGEMGGFHYYIHDDFIVGPELWKSDGTLAGTSLVKDINPGFDSMAFYPSILQNQKTYQLNGYLYFPAAVGGLTQLWRTDGTLAGTQSFIDFSPTDSVYEAYRIVGEFNGRMYFVAKASSTEGRQLHWTDGTTNGFIDIRPGSGDDVDHEQMDPFIFKNQMFFMCANGFKDVLCRLNADHTLTYMTSCLVATDCVDYPEVIGRTQDRLFFTARTVIAGNDYGFELWSTDGTPSGNVFLGDLTPSDDSVTLAFNADLSGLDTFYFMNGVGNTSTLSVWSSDGTPGGTQLLRDLHEAGGWPWAILGNEWYTTGYVVGDKFVFASQSNAHGVELWSTDGTPANTVLLKDIFSGNSNGLSTSSSLIERSSAVVNNKLVFSARNNTNNYELWVTDGTSAGTEILKEIFIGTSFGSNPKDLTLLNGKVYFIAESLDYGNEVWETDGTSINTKLFYDITVGEDGSYPRDFKVINNTLFYTADSSLSTNLLSYSSSTGDGGIFKDFSPGDDSNVSIQSIFGSHLYFTAYDINEGRVGLWKSDGTLAGTELVMPVLGENSNGNFGGFYAGNTQLYFVSSDNVNSNYRLWKTDGANTSIINSAIVYNANGTGVTRGNEVLTHSTNTAGRRKVRYSADGTSLVEHTINTTVDLDASYFFATSDAFFFVGTDDSDDRELYRTDGPTLPVKLDLNATGSSEIIPLTTMGADFYFMADIGTGVYLYKANASSVTQIKQVSDVFATTEDTIYTKPIVWNSKIYFSMNDGNHGYELWVTDGTSVGTEMVKDLQVGSASGGPHSLFVYNNKLYFAADDGVRGYEIYESDGTEVGTVLKFEILSGAASAYPSDFYEYNGKIYFTADDGVHGFELWVMEL